MGEGTWTVVMPVKRLDAAKSRLRGALKDVPHPALALALARDAVVAVLSSQQVRQVLVVTNDPVAGPELQRLGARTVADPAYPGINAAFAHGASLAPGEWVAALAADLPALRPADLTAALRAARSDPAGVRRFVADAPGTGTVLLTAPPGVPLDPRFGPDSAVAHTASGALPLVGAWPSLRRDVDTPADLWAAAALGLGPHTAALLDRLIPPAAEPQTAPTAC